MALDVPDVAHAVRGIVADVSASPTLRQLMLRLTRAGERERGPGSSAAWSALVLGSCQALGGDTEAAVWCAAAVEFATAAAEVVDDLVDDEWDDETISPSRAVNASAGLILLGRHCLDRLSDSLGPQRVRLMGDILTRGYLEACSGEDLDLQLEAMPDVTEEQAYEMTQRKSGSLVAMACELGAAVATCDPTILEAVADFGCHVGMVAQILNDLASLDSAISKHSSDLRRKKKTLPVTFALSCARDEGQEALLTWYLQPSTQPDAVAEQEIAAMIRDLGGLHYGWALADIHRRAAVTSLDALAEITGRPEVFELRGLIPKDGSVAS